MNLRKHIFLVGSALLTLLLTAGCGTSTGTSTGGTPSESASPGNGTSTGVNSESNATTTGMNSAVNGDSSSSNSTEPVLPPDNVIRRIPRRDAIGNHHFDNAVSIWQDGLWSEHATGQIGPRYVMSFKGDSTSNPLIEVYNENYPSTSGEDIEYVCPKNAGELIITGITNHGNLVHFTTSQPQGGHGTLDLTTHEWNLSS